MLGHQLAPQTRLPDRDPAPGAGAVMPAPAPPQSGPDCLCCANHGVLPAAHIDGKAVGMPGLVDGQTTLRCCDACVGALFLGGTHPHPLNPLLRGSR